MVDRSLGFIPHANVLIAQKPRKGWNRGNRPRTLQSQRPGGVSAN